MRKKLFTMILSILSLCCFSLGAVACDGDEKNNASDGNAQIETNNGTTNNNNTNPDGNENEDGDDAENDDGNDDGNNDENNDENDDENDGNDDDSSSGGDSPSDSTPTPTEGLEYQILDNHYYLVIGMGTSTDTDIVIPSEYRDLPVIGINASAFEGCTNLTSVTLLDGITGIDDSAFKGCSGLTSVTIPDSVTFIGKNVFEDCANLIQTENGVSYVDDWVVACAPSAASVSLPATTRGICNCAFEECTSLTSVSIPNSVTSIPTATFRGCSTLTNVTIPDSVTSIESFAFSGCYDLANIYITDIAAWCSIDFANEWSNPLMYEGSKLYLNDNEITGNIVITDGVAIPDYTFRNCANLTSVVIPEGATSVGKGAFYGCENLTSITIPSSVTSIDEDAFWGCYDLASVHIADITAWCSIDFSCNPLELVYESKLYLNNTEITGDIVITDGVAIPSYTFRNCADLTGVTLPRSITSIGESVFEGCNSLTSITVAEENANYQSIDGNLYSKGGNTLIQYAVGKTVAQFTVPDNVTGINARAFYGCDSLTEIIIPDSVTSIGNFAFYGCPIQKVTLPAMALYYIPETHLQTAIITSGDQIRAYSCDGCINLTSLTLPDSITSIGYEAFKGCTSLESVTLPKNLISIVGGAFRDCSSLTNIVIPNKVTDIGTAAFSNCSDLTSVTIPDGATSIGDGAFYNCPIQNATLPTTAIRFIPKTSLKTVTITSGERIENEAFKDCTTLTSVNFSSANTSIIGAYAFYGCNKLTSVNFSSENISVIDDYAFYGCSKLQNVSLEWAPTVGDYAFYGCSDLESITAHRANFGNYAFYGCSGLTSVSIGNNVTSIGTNAFEGCNNLTSVSFANPNGWTAGSTEISSGALQNTATAATHLKSTYCSYAWTRTGE